MQTKRSIGLAGSFLPLLALGSLLLLLSAPVSASTPPFLPVLSVPAPNASVAPGSGLPITAHWEQDGAPCWVPPDRVPVTLYAIPEGEAYATYLLNRTKSVGGSGENTADYLFTVPSSEIPAGEFMLIAVDPLSGALARKMAVLHGSRQPGNAPVTATPSRNFFSQPQMEVQLFP